MFSPFPIPDPTDPPFTAVNEATPFHPFDPIALNWHPTATEAEQTAVFPQFTLGTTYTVKPGQTAPLFLPFWGVASWQLKRDATGQLVSRTLIVEMSAKADKQALFVGGIDAASSRLLLTFDPSMEDRLRPQMEVFYEDGMLKRMWFDEYELVPGDDGLVAETLPDTLTDAERKAHHFQQWFDGLTATSWAFTESDTEITLMELTAGESVTVHAQVQGKLDQPWWYCNVGHFLKALQVVGDSNHDDNALQYEALSGGHMGLVSSSGIIPEKFEDIVTISGGSRDSVVLQPAVDDGTAVPATLFTFSTAEDITLFSPQILDQPVSLLCAQPGLTEAGMSLIKKKMKATKGTQKKRQRYDMNNAKRIYIPPVGEPILASFYGKSPRKLPASRSKFLNYVEDQISYPESLEKKADLEPVSSLEITFNLNEWDDCRPDHLPWKKQRPQLRRLYPLRLKIQFGAQTVRLEQDERDCIRQEYIFHMHWWDDKNGNPYFQSYSVNKNFIPAQSHHIGVDNDGKPVPAIGKRRHLLVPTREIVRPFSRAERSNEKLVKKGLARYRRSTRLFIGWEHFIDQLRNRVAHYAENINRVLEGLESNTSIGLDTDLIFPTLLESVVKRYYELIQAAGDEPHSEPLYSVDALLQIQITGEESAGKNIITRFKESPDKLAVSSSWRPPEHNESVSKTPASNHQLGEALDIQPIGAGQGKRNPLVLFCLHQVALEIYMAKKLRECLLEQSSREFVVFLVEVDYLDNKIIEKITNNKYSYFRKDIIQEYEIGDFDVEYFYEVGVTGKTPLDRKVAVKFRERLEERNSKGIPWPDPPPTYLDMYLYALADGSHVHFTLKNSYVQHLNSGGDLT